MLMSDNADLGEVFAQSFDEEAEDRDNLACILRILIMIAACVLIAGGLWLWK
jgi:hypothetical protein